MHSTVSPAPCRHSDHRSGPGAFRPRKTWSPRWKCVQCGFTTSGFTTASVLGGFSSFQTEGSPQTEDTPNAACGCHAEAGRESVSQSKRLSACKTGRDVFLRKSQKPRCGPVRDGSRQGALKSACRGRWRRFLSYLTERVVPAGGGDVRSGETPLTWDFIVWRFYSLGTIRECRFI